MSAIKFRKYFSQFMIPIALLEKKRNGTVAETFADIIWVSDTITNKFYMNRFCAEGKSVENYKQWDLVTGCFDLVVDKYYSMNNAYLSTHQTRGHLKMYISCLTVRHIANSYRNIFSFETSKDGISAHLQR